MGEIDLGQAGRDLQAVFPQLGPVTPRRVLGEGFRSVAIETAEGWVFRLAKSPAATAGQAKETRLLPALRPRLPLPIPDPRWYAGPSARFPFGVIGYPKLPGIPLQPSQLTPARQALLAADLAAFLHALHAIPPFEASAWDLFGLAGHDAAWAEMRDDTLPSLRAALAPTDYQTVGRWWGALLADDRVRYTPVAVIHGDLWYENILVDPVQGRVTGILDFEDAMIGDPAQDFAALLYLGEPFTYRVLAAYSPAVGRLGPAFAHRLRVYQQLREFAGLQFALQMADAAEVEDALGKIRNGPLLQPRS